MDEKLEKCISTLEYILNNMFVYFVVYYSILAWFYFNKENRTEYKFIQSIKSILVNYNDLILFISVTTLFIACFIRILFHDHGIGIKEDDNSRAIAMLSSANKLERIGLVLFFTIIPLSLYYNLNNSLKYILFEFLGLVIVVTLSKTVLLIKRKIDGSYY